MISNYKLTTEISKLLKFRQIKIEIKLLTGSSYKGMLSNKLRERVTETALALKRQANEIHVKS